MPKQPKCPTCSKGWCKTHLFELEPIRKDIYIKKIQKIRLCPKLNKTTNHFYKTIPIFNQDKKYYTPSFMGEEEEVFLSLCQNFYEENDQRMRENHDHKINLNNSGDSSMWVPKHGRKKNYCSVCHSEYEDYLNHIESQEHKAKLKNNRFNGYINELEKKMKDRFLLEKVQKKAETSQIDETADVLMLKNYSEKVKENQKMAQIEPQ